MAFNSLAFLVFFPIVLVGYYVLPHRGRWVWLLAASIYFYGNAQPIYLLQFLAATALSYLLALKIEQEPDKPRKKRLLTTGVVLLVANLFVFKYTSFFNETLRTAFGWAGANYPVPVISLILPIGISFYTFQLISYLVDVFRGTAAERHFGLFALYTSFFPKVVSGPIERAKNLLPQFREVQTFDIGRLALGIQLILWGVFKKVFVADRLAPFVRSVYENPADADGVAVAFATFLFAFQVYADFSGYTDIALGIGQTLGLKLTNNFNRPYVAISIQDFWKRWHISLTNWLTDYVYTPLTRSKAIKIKWFYLMLVSLFITFVVSGLWHGSEWTFVIWGALHGSYLVISMLTQKWRAKCVKLVGLDRFPKLHRAWKIAVTFLLVCLAYVFFQARNLSEAFHMLGRLPFGWTHPMLGISQVVNGLWAELLLGLLGIGTIVLVDALSTTGDARDVVKRYPAPVRWAIYQTCLLGIVLLGAFYGTDAKFIYFQF